MIIEAMEKTSRSVYPKGVSNLRVDNDVCGDHDYTENTCHLCHGEYPYQSPMTFGMNVSTRSHATINTKQTQFMSITRIQMKSYMKRNSRNQIASLRVVW
eukprot:74439_1